MSDKRPEQSIASARASVMIYDDLNKKWVPSGSSHGLSKVHIYHHFLNNTFRVVGRKLQDHEVVINCAILKGLKYNQATPTFHQWRDNKQVYGLNFSSKDDAEVFATAMLRSLEVLNTGGQLAMRAAPTPPAMQSQQQQPNNRQLQQQQQQLNMMQNQQQIPVYQQPHQHQINQNDGSSSNYDIYDEYSTGSNHYNNSTGAPNSHGSGSHPNSIHYGSDGGYESSQVSIQQQQDNEMERRLSLQQQMSVGANGQMIQNPHQTLHTVNSSPNMLAQQMPPTTITSPVNSQMPHGHSSTPQMQAPSSPQTNQHQGGNGHQRNGSAPPVPPPAPPPPPGGIFMAPPAAAPAPPAPAPPPPPPAPGSQQNGPSAGTVHGGAVPPPPPPPMPNLHASQSSDHVGGLAAALQAAKLKKTNRGGSSENSGGSTTSSNSSGYGTLGNVTKKESSGGGMASMMDEMQKTLARRRAKVDKDVEEEKTDTEKSNGPRQRLFEKGSSPSTYGDRSSREKSQSNSGSESPKPRRTRLGSLADEIDVSQRNGDSTQVTHAELQAFKQEILDEMRKEMDKMKRDIIEAIKSESNRR